MDPVERPVKGSYATVGLALILFGSLATFTGLAYYVLWCPWMAACGGPENYCGGSFAPPDPRPPQALLLGVAIAAFVAASGSLRGWVQSRPTADFRGSARSAHVGLPLVAGLWLLGFLVYWNGGSWGSLWGPSTQDVITGLFFASLVVAPFLVAVAGLLLLKQGLTAASPGAGVSTLS